MDKETYSKQTKKAVRHFWKTRNSATKKNKKGERSDVGTRGGATAGKNLDGFTQLIIKQLSSLGISDLGIHEKKKVVTLPGYYRPTKQWDLVVTHGKDLLAAVEFKSLGGPSFGNNANNRCEEAIGSALDFRTVQREGGFGKGVSPFLGYFILVHDEDKSRREPKSPPTSPHFDCDSEFAKASYQRRMTILCERMMQESLYDIACAMSSPPNACRSGLFTDLSETASFHRLIVKLSSHIRSETDLI